jgi:hypothetical protein
MAKTESSAEYCKIILTQTTFRSTGVSNNPNASVMKKTILFVVVALLAFSCHEDDDTVQIVGDDYFPLQVGNYWEYEPASNMDLSTKDAKSIITGTKVIDGHEYAVMVRTFGYAHADYVDTVYYRTTSDGFVYSRTNRDDEESNVYRLAASKGDSWIVDEDYFSFEGRMAVTEVAPIILNTTTIDDCKTFYFNVETMADEEHYVIIGPGYGIIQSGSAWGFDRILKKAFIDGQEYNF